MDFFPQIFFPVECIVAMKKKDNTSHTSVHTNVRVSTVKTGDVLF